MNVIGFVFAVVLRPRTMGRSEMSDLDTELPFGLAKIPAGRPT